MSGYLRDAAHRIAASGRLPVFGGKTRSALEKAVERLADRETGSAREAEPWDDFLARIGVIER